VEARLRASEEAQRPFDLGRGPLLRTSLLKLGAEEHVLLLTMHHIVSDGWSAGVLVREMGALYAAYAQGGESPLEELAIQYGDYARWQREWLQGEVLEEQLGYWREQLAGAPPVLELPTDRPRPPSPTLRGGREMFTIPEGTAEVLRALGRREGATLFMTLLAAFDVLLSRYTGQDDIVVGTPIAGRTRAEVEGLIGFFVNTLVVRARVEAGLSFREVLGRVKEACLGAYAHQDVPFEKLVEELHPERSLTHTPLFQVMFVFQSGVPEGLGLAEVNIDLERTANGTARFDLYLAIEDGEELKGSIEYNTDVYDASTIQHMIGHFQTLLAAAAVMPEQKIAELPLLTEKERRRILVEWNDTAAAYPSDICVHELFEEQAARTPEALAVVFEDERLTYGELNERANRLAHYLRGQGVASEALVGLMLERSTELLVALLGVLKAGGAYVPLDPTYPAERLAFMLEDAGIRVLLTQGTLGTVLPPGDLRSIDLKALAGELAQLSSENPAHARNANELAYVIYTSGSTGRPKGVQIRHGAVVNFLTSMQRQPGISGQDVLTAVTTLSFDIAVLELMLPLTAGACVVMMDRETATDGVRLSRKMSEVGATLMQATPATWRLLLQAGWEAGSDLTILCGGEAWGLDLAALLLRGGASVWNMYGPTETTIWSTTGKIKHGDDAVLIGRPIANTQVYILDRYFQPVPAGVAGDLYVGGDGLARGYLNRPSLTAERFVPDPFSTTPGQRLYRTGDLARYLPDGSLDYLGRGDQQVKLRGYRIELGEVEAVLASHPAVREAVVVAREETSGDRRLVAYLVPASTSARPTAAVLRTHLRERLPDYMVPSAFVLLDALPLTPNGKVDRRALPAPDAPAGTPDSGYVMPRTPTEEVLCGIWTEVLGTPRVGIDDDFFELGGHSLLATQVVSRVREALQVEVPLRALFEASRPRQLAARVDALLRGGTAAVAPPLVKVMNGGDAPLSFAQQRLWFLDQLEPGSPAYNIPAAVRLTGALNVAALERTLDELVRRHEVLRTVFISEAGQPRQLVREHTAQALEVTDLSHLPQVEREVEARLRASEEAQRPFDLGRGPLLRTSLLKLGAEEHVLLLTMHHIVSDGWSAGVLVREMGALYAAYAQGGESPLEELAIQYGDYARWQREWLQGEVLEEQLGYWREQLAGAPPVLELPTDRPRPAVQTFRGAHENFKLPGELVEALRALGRREGATLFMTLLAAFQSLMHRYSGQPDMVVGTDVANRNSTEVEKLIGFFVNQVVLRTNVDGDPTFREVLRRVKEACLGAYAHQDVPFEKLVDVLRPERSLSYTPLIQAKLVLGHLPTAALRIGELEMNPLEIDHKHAQLDLILNLVDTGQELRGRVEYGTDLFNAATVGGLCQEFEIVLRAVASDPALTLADLKKMLVDRSEQRRAVAEASLEETSLLQLKGSKRRAISVPG
jgi:amino acid adenylation domain-containing protein